MGLISVQPPAAELARAEKKVLLAKAADKKLPPWVLTQCEAVGGTEHCLEALVEALGLGLES